jgi:hypothetical protein
MNSLLNRLSGHKWQIIAVFFAFPLFFSSVTHAVESFAQLNKGDQPGSSGYSFGLSDEITDSRNYRWGMAYTNLDELEATWNNKDVYFSTKTLDAYLAYRYFPNTYNSLLRKFSFEFQVGASVALTENKFTFEENNLDTEITFSEKGDVNGLVSFSTLFNLSKQSKVELGYKYYPSFSEFGGVGVVFLGINYQFGRKNGYQQ